MKVFYKYLIKEIGIIFFLGCAFFLFLLTMEDCISLLKFGFNGETFKMFFLLIPATLGFVLPMAFLLSLIIGLGKQSSSNVIITIESSGISMKKTICFIIIFSLFLSFLAIFINGNLAPKALFEISTITDELTKSDTLIKEKTFTKTGEREIYVDRINGERLMDIYITEGSSERIIFAKKGRIEDSLLLLENGQIHELDRNDPKMYHIMKFSSLSIPIGERKDAERTSIQHLTLSELYQFAFKSRTRRQGATTEGLLSVSRKEERQGLHLREQSEREEAPVELPIDGKQRSYTNEGELVLEKRKSNPYILTEFHKRLSLSFASFFFCLLAIPLGLRIKKQEKVFGLGASTIIILLYYIIFLGCEGFSKNGIISGIILWLPNIIFGLLGGVMLRRLFFR